MSKRTWIILGCILIGFAGIMWYINNKNAKANDLSNIDLTRIILPSENNGEIGDHVRGNSEAKVVLIEYGDFQCPSCSSVASRIKVIAEEYKDDVAFIFRNFPLPNMHANAKVAAAAAEAAGLQGKYWEMHDYLYKNQSAWSSLSLDSRDAWFAGAATDLGLETGRLVEDMGSTPINSKISFDTAAAKKAGAPGTPSFFLNGEMLDGETWGDDQELKKALDSKIAEAKETPIPTLEQP